MASGRERRRRRHDLRGRLDAARAAGADPVAALGARPGVADWFRETAKILIPLGVGAPGQIFVEFIRPELPPERPIATPAHLNTLDYAGLKAGFDRAVALHGGEVDVGLRADRPTLEDGLPWFEVHLPGRLSVAKGKAFAKDLAKEMNIRVLFNRVEADEGTFLAVGCMDFDPDAIGESPVPAYARTEEAAEFFDDYGTPVLPPKPPRKAKPAP